MRAHVDREGTVYLHHFIDLPGMRGVVVERAGADGIFVPVAEEPVMMPQDPAELVRRLGGAYDRMEETLGVDSPQEMWLEMSTGSGSSVLSWLLHPELAVALGRLVQDERAPRGERVRYRIQPVDIDGERIGEVVETAVTVRPDRVPAPEELEASNDGTYVTLEWTYPQDAPLQVRGFDIFAGPSRDALRRVNDRPLVRAQGEDEYSFGFEVPRAGATYVISVVARDIMGQQWGPEEPLSYLVEDNVPPAAVRGLGANVQRNGVVELAWPVSPEADLEGYRVYRAPRSTGPWDERTSELVDPFEPFFVDREVELGSKYVYSVTAVDAAGNESGKSTIAQAMVEDHQAPPAPTSFVAEYDSTAGVRLSWHADLAPDHRTFVLLRRRVGRHMTAYERVNRASVRETRFLDTGDEGARFEEGLFYQYAVVAADSAANVSDTTYAKIRVPDTTPPAAPAGLQARIDEGVRVALAWPASASADVERYAIYRAPADTAEAKRTLVDHLTRFYRDEQVSGGERYIYRVTAIDSLGNESETAAVDTLLFRDGAPPQRVRNVQAVALTAEAGVQIRWESVSDDDVAAYEVLTSSIATGIFEPVARLDHASTNWVDEEGTAGTWYRVRAIDTSQQEGRMSSSVQAIQK